MALKLRIVTDDEQSAIERLAHSRTASARAVERARVIMQASTGARVPVIAQRLNLAAKTIRRWLKRFNARGLAGLNDQPRSGRPTTYTPEQVAEVVVAALTDPQQLGLPFGSWTLDRLAVYLKEQKEIAIKRSRIDELLVAEGLRWRSQETWFGERVDPEFAKKRGASNSFTPLRRKRAS